MKAVINNQLVEYLDEGSGKVLLLLHGWGTNLSTYDYIASDLTRKYRVIRFDFPGFGKSSNPIGDWSVDDYARLTTELIDKLKVKKIHTIIGHSFGGRVAIKSVSNKYLNPEKLILIGSAGVKPKKSFRSKVYKFIAKFGSLVLSLTLLNRFRDKLRSVLYKSVGSVDYINSGDLQKTFLKVINEDLIDDASKILLPTLLIWGEDDNETPVADAKKMLSVIKHGSLEVIPNTGHFVYKDAADVVIKDIRRFIS